MENPFPFGSGHLCAVVWSPYPDSCYFSVVLEGGKVLHMQDPVVNQKIGVRGSQRTTRWEKEKFPAQHWARNLDRVLSSLVAQA